MRFSTICKNHLLWSTFAGAMAVNCAWAEVDDPLIYDLTGVVNTGSNTVLVCGTQDCGSGDFGGVPPAGTDPTDADLRTLDSSGYAIFSVIEYGPAGSGYIDPFLRFQHNEQTGKGSDTVETAYNTNDGDDGPSDKLQSKSEGDAPGGYDYENQAKDTTAGGKQDPGDFNHAILYSDLGVDDQGFVTFLLDINEPNSDGKSTLRLDELSFFISTSPELGVYDPQLDKFGDPIRTDCESTFDDSNIGTADSLGCFRSSENYNVDGSAAQTYKVWDMDLDDIIGAVMLENVGSDGSAGSGDYDLSVRLSAALFDAYAEKLGGGELYVYLENTAGATDDYSTGPNGEVQAGFEEWAFISGTRSTDVPVPGSLFLTGLGLLLLAGRRVRNLAAV